MFLMVQPIPVWVWLLGWALTLYALWTLREELYELSDAHPTATRFGCALLFSIVCAVSLEASVIYAPCDWDKLMEMCSGNEWCAWGMWFGNGCPFRAS